LNGSSSTIREGTWIFIKTDHDFNWMESWWHLLKGSSPTKKKGNWPFTKATQSILFALNRDCIYWWELFNHKITNLTLDKRFSVHFIATISWWYLSKGYSTIWEETWSFKKHSLLILLARSREGIYWRGVFPR
jgi:hypothetical protein